MRATVVGLGKMGSTLARRLLEQGVEVAVWNRSPAPAEALVAAGATRVEDLSSAWRGADAVFTFLADDAAVEAVYLGDRGLFEAAPEGTLFIEMSTISPAASALLGARAEARRLAYLRCPVSGNPSVLAAGNLTLIVSGDLDAFEDAKGLLGLVGPSLLYVGGADEARVMKLAVNAMLAATAEMLAEAITLCEASGIDRAVALEVLASSAAGSPFIAYKRDALIARRYDATFTTAMLVKDLTLVGDLAAQLAVPLPVARVVAKLAEACCEEDLGGLDFLALLPHLQSLAGRPTDVPVGTRGP